MRWSEFTYSRDLETRRALLVGLERRGGVDTGESLTELAELCRTLGIEVVDSVIQRRDKPDVAFFVGTGKLERIKNFVVEKGIDVIIFDDELTPVQQRNIEDYTGRLVLDRTQVILEIFSRHATTAEGKVQVELAKLVYELPRLRGKGEILSNPGGGIGTRGPGETALEVDRRKIKARIAELKRRIAELRKNRETLRKARLEAYYPVVSIVGYTNAGKSTLLRYLSKDTQILVSDQLFSTLNPSTKRVKLPGGRVVLFSDTVGFVRKLPHTLVEAFRSTLEEVLYSDLILVLVDMSDGSFREKLRATLEVLTEIGAHEKPRVLVFNKVDLVPSDYREMVRYEFPDAVFISALTGVGIELLLEKVTKAIRLNDECIELELSPESVNVVERYRELIEIRYICSGGLESQSMDSRALGGPLRYRICGPRNVVEKVKNSLRDEIRIRGGRTI